MPSLQKKYTQKGVVWLSICSSAEGKQGHYDKTTLAQKQRVRGASHSEYLHDTSGEVGNLYGAKTTPHMFIINKQGVLVYNGAIDSIKSAKIDDIEKAQNYVASSLDALLAGKPIKESVTKPYGCSVKY